MRYAIVLIGMICSLSSFAQEINQIIIDADLNKETLIGNVNDKGLRNAVFVEDWKAEQIEYSPDKTTIKELKKLFKENKEFTVKVFFASWCHDSQLQLPPFVKIAKQVRIKNIEYIALNRKKALPNQDISAFDIKRVPTFIVFKDGKEMGRIIETPQLSIEKDLLRIIK